MKNNNYPNWLVSLEIAKELKEIGFNGYCPFFLYPNDDEMVISGTVTVEEDWLDEDKYGEVTIDYGKIIIDLVVAPLGKFNKFNFQTIPTWEQVFEWFRSKGYHGVIAARGEDGENEYSYCIDYLNELSSDFEQDSHLTYEEAREALVKALIQTYKSEQL